MPFSDRPESSTKPYVVRPKRAIARTPRPSGSARRPSCSATTPPSSRPTPSHRRPAHSRTVVAPITAEEQRERFAAAAASIKGGQPLVLTPHRGDPEPPPGWTGGAKKSHEETRSSTKIPMSPPSGVSTCWYCGVVSPNPLPVSTSEARAWDDVPPPCGLLSRLGPIRLRSNRRGHPEPSLSRRSERSVPATSHRCPRRSRD